MARGLHESMRPDRPGTMVRDKDVWEFAAYDVEFARGGASELRYVLHYDEAGDADGFATYRFKDKWNEEPEGEVRIREIWAEDPAAHAGLWRYLLDLDLARTFTWSGAPVDEPLRHLVTDARAVGTSISDSLYVRVVDVQAALAARQYAAGVDLVIEIDDPILPENTGPLPDRHRRRPRGLERRGHPRDVSARHLDGHPRARHHLPGRRTPERPGPSTPHHRAHPRRRIRSLDSLRLAPGPLVPGQLLTPGSRADYSRGGPMTWVPRELSQCAAAQEIPTRRHARAPKVSSFYEGPGGLADGSTNMRGPMTSSTVAVARYENVPVAAICPVPAVTGPQPPRPERDLARPAAGRATAGLQPRGGVFR